MIEKKGRSQVTFIFRPSGDKCQQVSLAGDFNDWQPSLGKMVKQKDGTYRKRLQLDPGEHRYKFYVDGQWVADPEAETCVPNPFGTVDSLLVI